MAAGLVKHAQWMRDHADIRLPGVDLRRIQALRDPTRRDSLAAALRARRFWLANQLSVRPQDIQLEESGDGQPRLCAPEALSVSFSRSDPFSAMVICRKSLAVGLDVETVRPIEYAPALAMICAPEEAAILSEAISGTSDPSLFFRLWTLKEAILKATGRGFRADARQVRIQPEMLRTSTPLEIFHDKAGGYLAQWLELEGCVLAVALAQPRSDSRTHIGSTS